ncbi:MAG: hypothetical protein BWZ02_02454 [Lentisphaerae bacterium ADurb.BinA184]|nr:MAG: hypothetical protein BWZ02_02454 [Lentisphaerae bacterium ADurb.BinA184]
MRTARVRDDSCNTVYDITNRVVGSLGQIVFGRRERVQLDRTLRRLSSLYTIAVLSIRVWPTGYRIICSAPSETPDRAIVEMRFRARYGRRVPLPDLDVPGVLEHWSERLRNISCLFKDLQQCFTQWYNRVAMGRRRAGTVWRDRFKSAIVRGASQLLAAVSGTRGPGNQAAATRFAVSHWRVFRRHNPDLALALVTLRPSLSAPRGLLAPLLPTGDGEANAEAPPSARSHRGCKLLP